MCVCQQDGLVYVVASSCFMIAFLVAASCFVRLFLVVVDSSVNRTHW